MLDVFITVDVEIWCEGWKDIDRKFPAAFRSYVYGPTRHGNFGLPRKIAILRDHGLQGVFFVEPLFSARFGRQPLEEIVGLLKAGEQEIQLHLHTEWVDEATQPLLKDLSGKRQHLRQFSRHDQIELIRIALGMLLSAGAPAVNAFRAGNFGFNRDTLHALAENAIPFDSSYNATIFGPDSGVLPGVYVVAPMLCGQVCEVPMTVYFDGIRGLRHVSITACSYREIEGLMWRALEAGRTSFVLLSHNFELLNRQRTHPDWVTAQRFDRLCRFLDRNRDTFRVRGFHGLTYSPSGIQPEPLSSPAWKAIERLAEQTYRRLLR